MSVFKNSKILQVFLTLLSAYSMVCIPGRMHAQECCEPDNQASYDHWLWNRKVLLVAVPVVAGAAAVALATSGHNNSFYTGYPYGSPYFSNSSEFYDDYYYLDSSFNYYSDYDYSSSGGGMDPTLDYLRDEPHHHIAKERSLSRSRVLNPVVTVDKLNGPATFTASVRSADGSLIESSSLTTDKPGTLNFDPIAINGASESYKVELSYSSDGTAELEGVLATTLRSETDEQAQITPFKSTSKQPLGEVKQDFVVTN